MGLNNAREHPTEQESSSVGPDGSPPLQGSGIERQGLLKEPQVFPYRWSGSVYKTNQGGTAEIITRPLQQLHLCNGRVFWLRTHAISGEAVRIDMS